MDELEFYNGQYTGEQIDAILSRTGYAKSLGTTDSLADQVLAGYYYWATSPTDAPFGYGFMVVIPRGSTSIQQICYNSIGAIAVRNIYVGTPSEWFWHGMTLADGVEFATAEHFLGNTKTVYVQTKNVGSITANTVKTVAFASNLPARGHILRCSAEGVNANNTNNMLVAPFDDGNNTFKANAYYYASSNVWSARIGLLSSVDMTNVYATLWYTKE